MARGGCGHTAWGRRAAFCALLGLASATRARSDDLSGRALLSYQKLDTGVFRTDGLHQTYDLRLQRMLLPTLQLRLSFRGERNDGNADLGGGRVKNSFWQLQPGGELFYSLPKLQVQASYDLLRTNSSNGLLAGGERRLERESARLNWRPDDLPALSLLADRRINEDRGSGLDIHETTIFGAIDWSWKGLKLFETNRLSRLDDGGVGFARKNLDLQGTISHEAVLWNGRVSTFASVQGAWTRLDERATASASVLVPRQVPVAVASAVVDDTPLDSRDRPLVPNAALNDGNFDASAGVSVGPSGSVYENLAADMGRPADVDEIRVHVRDGAGNLVPLGGAVRWDPYSSADGLSWTPVSGGARTFFNAALSRYEVSFRKTSSRWFKVVGFGLNSVDTRVTEIDAWEHAELGGLQTRRTFVRLGNGAVTLTGKPVKGLTLLYFGLFNTVQQDPSDRPGFQTRSSDQTISAEVTPIRRVFLTARYQHRGITQTGSLAQRFDGLTGVVRWAMSRSLDLSFEGTKTNEDNGGIPSRTTGLTLHTYLRLLPALDISFDAGSQRQDFTAGQRATDRVFLSGVSIAQLTTDLKVTLQASLQRSSYTQSIDVGPAQDSRDERYAAEVFWRPSQQLALAGRFGWAAGDVVSGLTQRYRVEWYPFPGGTVSLGGAYDQDVDPYAQRRSKRVVVTPRWTINRHAVFDMNYSLLEVTGTPSARTRIFYSNLTLTF